MKVPVNVNGMNTFAVIDTGADATIVSEKVATEAGIIVPDRSTSSRLLNATNDSEMIAIGGVTATIQLANNVYNWKVFVAPIRDPILLGLDFMKFINAIIYTGQGDIAIDGSIITSTYLDDDQQNASGNLVVDNNIITPAISNEIFLGRVVNPVPNRNSSQRSIPYSDRLNLYSSDEFPGWSNCILKKITDTNLATLDEDDVLLPSAMEDITATRKTLEAEEDAPLVTSAGPQRTSARLIGAREQSPDPITSPQRTKTGPVVRNEALTRPKMKWTKRLILYRNHNGPGKDG